ncbi:hypothetical protein QYM36_016098, partial [Artemia franciscana]
NRSQKTSTPSEIKDAHGHIIERELEVANYMNLHFASIGQSVANKLQHNLPHGQCDYRTYLVKPLCKIYVFNTGNRGRACQYWHERRIDVTNGNDKSHGGSSKSSTVPSLDSKSPV